MGRWSNMQQRGVLRLEPSRSGATIGGFIVMIVAGTASGVALAFHAGAWADTGVASAVDPPAAAVLGAAAFCALLAILAGASAVYNAARWRRARRIERLSSDPSLVSLIPTHETAPAAHRAATVPRLDVTRRRASKYAKPPARLRRVTAQANVIGHRPINLVYLRLFDNQPRIRTFVESAWREFGYVYFLRSATAVTRREYRVAKRQGSFAGMFIGTDDALTQAIRSAPIEPLPPGRRRFDDLGPTRIRTRDKYGAYPVRALMCHGSYWQRAVDVLLAQVDVAVLDLSGFTDRNAGTAYELQRVIDRFPIERTVIMCDPQSSTKLIAAALQNAWSRMDAASPNAIGGPRVATIVETDRFWRRSSSNDNGMDDVRLVSVRRHSRRLAAATQLATEHEWSRSRPATHP